MHSAMPLATMAATAALCCAITACGGGGTIDPCARFHSREQIPERHCPAPTDPGAAAAAAIHSHSLALNATHPERPTP